MKYSIPTRKICTGLALSALCLCLFATHEARAVESASNFVKDASIGNQFEIDSSQIALQKSQNDDIKKFAQQMIDDHTKAAEDLTTAISNAPEADIETPDGKLDSKHKKMLSKLYEKSGEDFDKLYVKDQVGAHDDAVSMFKAYAKKGEVGSLKSFAADTLPTLQSHQQAAHSLKSSM